MARTSLFKNNRTQSVRLPKDLAFPESVREVDIVAVGASRVITPSGMQWDRWFDGGTRTTADFLSERDQPADQERGE